MRGPAGGRTAVWPLNLLFLNPYLPFGAVSFLGHTLSPSELGNGLACQGIWLSPSHSSGAGMQGPEQLMP